MFGAFASKEFSAGFQRFLNNAYARIFSLDMSEFDEPAEYKSLNALFTRKLVKPRDINTQEKVFISPCDARITEFGALDGVELLQIKGKSYSLAELLASADEAANFANGQFANFYLSPKDYHRFHAPLDMQVLRSTHIPGKLYPVNEPALNSIDSLFAKNERVLLLCEDKQGARFYLVFVGALNVGKIALSFDDRVKTNASKNTISVYDYDELFLSKGDEIGMFEMGSSIVAIFMKDQLIFELECDQKVRFGQRIGITLR
jgi:phosphatidylserine decarboxylase